MIDVSNIVNSDFFQLDKTTCRMQISVSEGIFDVYPQHTKNKKFATRIRIFNRVV